MKRSDQGLSDAKILEMLDLRAKGVPASVIAMKFRCTRNIICGIEYRVRNLTDAADKAGNTEHLNGSMPSDWWVAGLNIKGRAAA